MCIRDRQILKDEHSSKLVYCGFATAARTARFFPGSESQINSLAVVNLTHDEDIGYLALGSVDKNRFAPHMGTDFLTRFGALLSARLAIFYS